MSAVTKKMCTWNWSFESAQGFAQGIEPFWVLKVGLEE
jgi:hypothetical protein